MQLPTVRGVIDRRILVNYRVDPGVLARQLPEPFRPKVVGGFGMVGICLIRLRHVRPAFLPAWMGIGSENAAHRTAVEWEENGERREGVYVRRRDTNSRLNTWLGGRLFPGVHHHARFDVDETEDRYTVRLESDDDAMSLAVVGRRVDALPPGSVFESLDEASAFFEAGSLGYSPNADGSRYEGLELRCHDWNVEPLAVDEVHSSVFEDESRFPSGSITFDCALLMRGIHHEWHGRPAPCGATVAAPTAAD